LKKVIFHSGLGTSYEKAERLARLAQVLAADLYPRAASAAERAAWLCKCDLVTEMVGEFPALQGVMGGIYARIGGEPEEVAAAINEHYLPKGAQEDVPETEAGTVVSLADKLDNICGSFGLGLIPTGTADPYALRRQSLAIITLCAAKGLHLDLRGPVRAALALLAPKLSRDPHEVEEAVVEFVIEFIKGRLEGLLLAQGFSGGAVQAALAVFAGDVLETRERAEALQRLIGQEDFERLAVLFKRVANIVEGAEAAEAVRPELFEKDEERALHAALQSIAPRVEEELARGDFYEAALALSKLKEAVDRFFEGVMVMVPEEAIRANRLALLRWLRDLTLRVADISKVAG
jgi:glycyl-tRNA synthetase beta chain